MQLLKGKEAADDIAARAKNDADNLKTYGISPMLAIVRVGENADDVAYERGATKRAVACGVEVRQISLSADTDTEVLTEVIEGLNEDADIHGILLLRPLPKHIDAALVCEKVSHSKDVDGITLASLAGVFTGQKVGFPSCTAAAVTEILDYYGIDAAGKNVAIAGRSLVVGKPTAMLLTARDATVTICHTKTRDLREVTRKADIVIVAAGRAGAFDDSYFSDGQTVIDVGINPGENGTVVGDVKLGENPPDIRITPVPGGVGAVTTAVLIKHVVEAARAGAK